jgi:hypothetical protein
MCSKLALVIWKYSSAAQTMSKRAIRNTIDFKLDMKDAFHSIDVL